MLHVFFLEYGSFYIEEGQDSQTTFKFTCLHSSGIASSILHGSPALNIHIDVLFNFKENHFFLHYVYATCKFQDGPWTILKPPSYATAPLALHILDCDHSNLTKKR